MSTATEVRAILRLLPGQGQLGQGGPPLRHRLMYLSTVDKGGEIVFPNAKVPNRFCVQVFRFWTVAVVEIKSPFLMFLKPSSLMGVQMQPFKVYCNEISYLLYNFLSWGFSFTHCNLRINKLMGDCIICVHRIVFQKNILVRAYVI
jgi:hypothetical protein